MIGTMYLAVAVHTTPVEGENIESSDGLMAHNHAQVTLLAQLVTAGLQQLDVIGTMRRMAGKTVLLHGGVLPEKRTALICVALIAKPVG
jgi:hypothetical protein